MPVPGLGVGRALTRGGTELAVGKSLVDLVGSDGSLPDGTFYIKKTIVSSAITTTGTDVTGNATGPLEIVNVVLNTNSTGLATGDAVVLATNNATGAATFMQTAVSGLGASTTIDLANASVTKKWGVIESGKKVTIKAATTACDGAGTVDVYLVLRRLAAGATIAAA